MMSRVEPVHMFEWSPREETDPFHTHNHLELGYCFKGAGRFHFGSKTYAASAGDVFVVNNLERHAASSDRNNPSVYYFIFFDPLVLEQADSELLQPYIYRPDQFTNRIAADEQTAREIGSLVMEMWRENTERKVGYKGVLLGKLIQISALLLRHYGGKAPGKEWLHALDSYYRLRKALDFIRIHFREPIHLQDVADAIHLSPSRTRHFFKERMGEGFKEYLMRVRIGEARKMLAGTTVSISRIMYECGFQSHAPFYRAFHKLNGISPLQYRERESKIALFEKFEPGT